ncbi:MRC1-like domain-containing protein [Trametes punicea]|nr:MRC1-like domain-containing protein [Trametes punicea]
MSSSSPAIRRATRTYGRRRDTSESNHDISFDAANTSIDTREDSYSSITYALEHELPPSSDEIDASNTSLLSAHAADSDAGDDEDNEDDGAGQFQFSWRAKLKQIDDGDFEPIVDSDDALLPRTELLEGKTNVPTRPASPVNQAAEDIFGGTLSSLTNSSRPSSLVVHTRVPRRIEAIPASEPESEEDIRPSTPQTSPRHTINTPQMQSSPTPPTSLEIPSKKGKGKQQDVNPFQSDADEQLASSSKAPTAGPSRRKKASDATKRVKVSMIAPTKKERIETQKATARIVAEQPVSITRVQQNTFPLSQFLKRFGPAPANRAKTPPIPSTPDPIQPFSSSPSAEHRDSHQRASSSRTTSERNEEFRPNGLLEAVAQSSDESDDAFPDVAEFRQAEQRKHAEKERLRQLQEKKLRALEQQKAATAIIADDTDDDLVIEDDPKSVAKEEAQKRRAITAHGAHPSRGRQKQLALARPSTRGARATSLPRDEEEARHLLETAAASSFVGSSTKKMDKPAVIDPATLGKILLQQDSKQKEKIIHEKEEDWKRRGGRIKEQPGGRTATANPAEALKDIIERTRAAARRPIEDAAMDQDDDSDGQYRPENPVERDGSQGSGGEHEENSTSSPSRADQDDQADDEGEDDDQPMASHPRRPQVPTRRRPIAAVVSDDEDDAENRPPASSRILVLDTPYGRQPHQHSVDGDAGDESPVLAHRSSMSSLGERTEDGTDKENDIRLSFPRGEDKENTAIAVQSPGLSLRQNRGFGSLFAPSMDSSPAGRSALDGVRSPLKELPADDEDGDDPFALGLTPGPLRLSSPAPDLGLEASPMSLSGGNELAPAFSLKPKGKERARSSSPSPLVEALPIGGAGFSQFFTQEDAGGGFERLKAAQRDDDISLTLDTRLQPALEVDQSLVKKADEIFEKEQELAIQEQQQESRTESKPQLFVDENGFLTQTRPEFRSPLHSMTPSQPMASLRLLTPGSLLSSERKPLMPLLTQDPDDDELDNRPLRRLQKRDDSPTPDHRSPTAPKLKNAFTVLGRSATRPRQKKFERSAFIEGEAEESDDDAAIGFGVRKKDDDDDEEEDGEDQDQTLAELVDDKEMDLKTLAEDKVREKAREHQEEDDKANEKIHLAAIKGDLRAKRRDRGVGFDNSDSEEDEEAKRIRAKAKRRRLKNDSIAALAKNPDTQAFAKEYNTTMAEDEDEDEFRHLKEDHMDVDAQEQESEEEREVVSADQLREQLREAARQRDFEQAFNPDDVSWVDHVAESADEMDTDVRVRELAADTSVGVGRGVTRETVNEKSSYLGKGDLERLARWAKTENASRTSGVVGRNTGGSAAVTGHAKSKTGNSSFKGSRASASSSKAGKASTTVAKAPSVLSAVSNRRNKFTN